MIAVRLFAAAMAVATVAVLIAAHVLEHGRGEPQP